MAVELSTHSQSFFGFADHPENQLHTSRASRSVRPIIPRDERWINANDVNPPTHLIQDRKETIRDDHVNRSRARAVGEQMFGIDFRDFDGLLIDIKSEDRCLRVRVCELEGTYTCAGTNINGKTRVGDPRGH